MQPLVSIIVPNYNHAPFLPQRLESIFGQTFDDFEVILLDDASTDGSAELLNTYAKHPKVSHFIVNEQNSGSPFKQWRKGIELAKGEYIWIAETDDFAHPEFLSRSTTVLKQNPKASLVYTDSLIVDGNGKEHGLWGNSKNTSFKTKRWSADYYAGGSNEILNYLLYKTTINNASAMLFRKDNFTDEIRNKMVQYKNVGDLFSYIAVLLQGDVAYLAQPLNYYRVHNENTTKKNQKSGVLYSERIHCFSWAIDRFMAAGIHPMEAQKLAKAGKHILKKNGFYLMDFGYNKLLYSFIDKLEQHKLLLKPEGRFLQFLYSIYGLNIYKVKGLSRKLIKKRL